MKEPILQSQENFTFDTQKCNDIEAVSFMVHNNNNSDVSDSVPQISINHQTQDKNNNDSRLKKNKRVHPTIQYYIPRGKKEIEIGKEIQNQQQQNQDQQLNDQKKDIDYQSQNYQNFINGEANSTCNIFQKSKNNLKNMNKNQKNIKNMDNYEILSNNSTQAQSEKNNMKSNNYDNDSLTVQSQHENQDIFINQQLFYEVEIPNEETENLESHVSNFVHSNVVQNKIELDNNKNYFNTNLSNNNNNNIQNNFKQQNSVYFVEEENHNEDEYKQNDEIIHNDFQIECCFQTSYGIECHTFHNQEEFDNIILEICLKNNLTDVESVMSLKMQILRQYIQQINESENNPEILQMVLEMRDKYIQEYCLIRSKNQQTPYFHQLLQMNQNQKFQQYYINSLFHHLQNTGQNNLSINHQNYYIQMINSVAHDIQQ